LLASATCRPARPNRSLFRPFRPGTEERENCACVFLRTVLLLLTPSLSPAVVSQAQAIGSSARRRGRADEWTIPYPDRRAQQLCVTPRLSYFSPSQRMDGRTTRPAGWVV